MEKTLKTTTQKPQRKQRTARGVVKAQPIALRLMPNELEQVKTLAQREQRSMANVCRLALLRGLANYEKTGLIG